MKVLASILLLFFVFGILLYYADILTPSFITSWIIKLLIIIFAVVVILMSI